MDPRPMSQGGTGVYNDTVQYDPRFSQPVFRPTQYNDGQFQQQYYPPQQQQFQQASPMMLKSDPEQGVNPAFVPRETKYVPQSRMDCVPAYLYSPWAILRFVELILGFVVLGLYTVTCNVGACVVYVNEFGRLAEGLGYNVFASWMCIIMTSIVIIMYGVNMHRAMPAVVIAIERAMYMFMCLLLIILAVIMAYYASVSDQRIYYDLARGKEGGIKTTWITAAVFAWVQFLVYVADLVGQCALGYPSVRHVNS